MKPKIGFALTGSFCTIEKALLQMEKLKENYDFYPILSERVAGSETRFFKKGEILKRAEAITRHKCILSVEEAEPIGPKGLLDLMVVCPCTGNTLAKMALGITDGCVTMAVKSHRRNGKGVLVALSTNDALSASAKNLGILLEKKGFWFLPLHQDAPTDKPYSLSCDFSRLPEAISAALEGKQLQPLFY